MPRSARPRRVCSVDSWRGPGRVAGDRGRLTSVEGDRRPEQLEMVAAPFPGNSHVAGSSLVATPSTRSSTSSPTSCEGPVSGQPRELLLVDRVPRFPGPVARGIAPLRGQQRGLLGTPGQCIDAAEFAPDVGLRAQAQQARRPCPSLLGHAALPGWSARLAVCASQDAGGGWDHVLPPRLAAVRRGAVARLRLDVLTYLREELTPRAVALGHGPGAWNVADEREFKWLGYTLGVMITVGGRSAVVTLCNALGAAHARRSLQSPGSESEDTEEGVDDNNNDLW